MMQDGMGDGGMMFGMGLVWLLAVVVLIVVAAAATKFLWKKRRPYDAEKRTRPD